MRCVDYIRPFPSAPSSLVSFTTTTRLSTNTHLFLFKSSLLFSRQPSQTLQHFLHLFLQIQNKYHHALPPVNHSGRYCHRHSFHSGRTSNRQCQHRGQRRGSRQTYGKDHMLHHIRQRQELSGYQLPRK